MKIVSIFHYGSWERRKSDRKGRVLLFFFSLPDLNMRTDRHTVPVEPNRKFKVGWLEAPTKEKERNREG